MRLRYTRLALADMAEVRTFIAEHNPGSAATTVASIRDAIDGLILFPERGRKGRIEGTRELVVPGTPFVVAYRIQSGELAVLAIMHGARRWPELFEPQDPN